ncbi:MAG: tetratricopeptide repeat protein, partial [Deltaproteobacteria bacterium]|nr:tetratricopeptide repeat protein [Deltaproteobacteria bacterium]
VNPESHKAYHYRGDCHRHKGEFAKAINDYTQAIRLNSGHAKGYWGRGLAYADAGAFEKAIVDYTEALRLNPQDYGPFGK